MGTGLGPWLIPPPMPAVLPLQYGVPEPGRRNPNPIECRSIGGIRGDRAKPKNGPAAGNDIASPSREPGSPAWVCERNHLRLGRCHSPDSRIDFSF